jgi:hypothetical protein
VILASVSRKPIGNIFSRKLTDAENVPKGKVHTPCRYFAYNFDVAFFNKKFTHGAFDVIAYFFGAFANRTGQLAVLTSDLLAGATCAVLIVVWQRNLRRHIRMLVNCYEWLRRAVRTTF